MGGCEYVDRPQPHHAQRPAQRPLQRRTTTSRGYSQGNTLKENESIPLTTSRRKLSGLFVAFASLAAVSAVAPGGGDGRGVCSGAGDCGTGESVGVEGREVRQVAVERNERGSRRERSTHQPLSSRRESLAPVHIAVQLAQATRVVTSPRLLSNADIDLVLEITRRVQASTSDPNHGNSQNTKHAVAHKHCTFLNKRPGATANITMHPELAADPFRTEAPHLLRKILLFADQSWRDSGWSDPGNAIADIAGPGSLKGRDGLNRRDGVAGLKIRVVEHWKYSIGGHLHDDFHYDGGSVITIVTALNDGYTGGDLATLEANGTRLAHPLGKGDSACFVSHKYHSISPVLTGERQSLVVELWQGGIPGLGRS